MARVRECALIVLGIMWGSHLVQYMENIASEDAVEVAKALLAAERLVGIASISSSWFS